MVSTPVCMRSPRPADRTVPTWRACSANWAAASWWRQRRDFRELCKRLDERDCCADGTDEQCTVVAEVGRGKDAKDTADASVEKNHGKRVRVSSRSYRAPASWTSPRQHSLPHRSQHPLVAVAPVSCWISVAHSIAAIGGGRNGARRDARAAAGSGTTSGTDGKSLCRHAAENSIDAGARVAAPARLKNAPCRRRGPRSPGGDAGRVVVEGDRRGGPARAAATALLISLTLHRRAVVSSRFAAASALLQRVPLLGVAKGRDEAAQPGRRVRAPRRVAHHRTLRQAPVRDEFDVGVARHSGHPQLPGERNQATARRRAADVRRGRRGGALAHHGLLQMAHLFLVLAGRFGRHRGGVGRGRSAGSPSSGQAGRFLFSRSLSEQGIRSFSLSPVRQQDPLLSATLVGAAPHHPSPRNGAFPDRMMPLSCLWTPTRRRIFFWDVSAASAPRPVSLMQTLEESTCREETSSRGAMPYAKLAPDFLTEAVTTKRPLMSIACTSLYPEPVYQYFPAEVVQGHIFRYRCIKSFSNREHRSVAGHESRREGSCTLYRATPWGGTEGGSGDGASSPIFGMSAGSSGISMGSRRLIPIGGIRPRA